MQCRTSTTVKTGRRWTSTPLALHACERVCVRVCAYVYRCNLLLVLQLYAICKLYSVQIRYDKLMAAHARSGTVPPCWILQRGKGVILFRSADLIRNDIHGRRLTEGRTAAAIVTVSSWCVCQVAGLAYYIYYVVVYTFQCVKLWLHCKSHQTYLHSIMLVAYIPVQQLLFAFSQVIITKDSTRTVFLQLLNALIDNQ